MNSNLKQYLEFIEDWERIQTETYLLLLRNAAGKKAEARKRICYNDENIDVAVKAARKYLRIMDYLQDRSERERKRRDYGNA
ncbi:MAG: hypothetical protein IH619_03435 [Ignavibacterium sp.]|nr:hypothetical protein [Ignavibacterium sp.]